MASSSTHGPSAAIRALCAYAAAMTRRDFAAARAALASAKRAGARRAAAEEAALMLMLYAGYPAALEGLRVLNEAWPGRARASREGRPADWRARGERLCRRVYGPAFAKLVPAVRALHPDLATWMVEHGYGRVLSRPGLSAKDRELVTVAALAALGWERQLVSHLLGALRVGGRAREIEGALLAGLKGDRRRRARRRHDRVAARARGRPEVAGPPDARGGPESTAHRNLPGTATPLAASQSRSPPLRPAFDPLSRPHLGCLPHALALSRPSPPDGGPHQVHGARPVTSGTLSVRARLAGRPGTPTERLHDALTHDLLTSGPVARERFPRRWTDTAALKSLVAAKRAPLDPALAREMTDYHRRLGASPASLANLERLARGEAVATVAGQQPAPLGGPLYSLHKTASAVGLAASVAARTGVAAVPMFWMHGEDSDFAEIRHATVADGCAGRSRLRAARRRARRRRARRRHRGRAARRAARRRRCSRW